jgi:tryptophan-rich sensory protein
MIWHQKSVSNPRLLKILYSLQIGAHWAWSPLFFRYHLVEVSLALILFMDVLMVTIMGLAYEKKRAITFLLIPNIVWISFATYLIFYIWTHN